MPHRCRRLPISVDLKKGSLYHHISSKQEILFNLLNDSIDLLTGQINAVLRGAIPADQMLREAIRVYLLTLLERRDLAAVLLIEHRSLSPELHARHVPQRDRFESLWREMIWRGQKEGIFMCDDAAAAVRATLGMLNWTITWYSPDGPLSPVQIADQYADLLLEGLKVRS